MVYVHNDDSIKVIFLWHSNSVLEDKTSIFLKDPCDERSLFLKWHEVVFSVYRTIFLAIKIQFKCIKSEHEI